MMGSSRRNDQRDREQAKEVAATELELMGEEDGEARLDQFQRDLESLDLDLRVMDDNDGVLSSEELLVVRETYQLFADTPDGQRMELRDGLTYSDIKIRNLGEKMCGAAVEADTLLEFDLLVRELSFGYWRNVYMAVSAAELMCADDLERWAGP